MVLLASVMEIGSKDLMAIDAMLIGTPLKILVNG